MQFSTYITIVSLLITTLTLAAPTVSENGISYAIRRAVSDELNSRGYAPSRTVVATEAQSPTSDDMSGSPVASPDSTWSDSSASPDSTWSGDSSASPAASTDSTWSGDSSASPAASPDASSSSSDPFASPNASSPSDASSTPGVSGGNGNSGSNGATAGNNAGSNSGNVASAKKNSAKGKFETTGATAALAIFAMGAVVLL